MQGRRQAHTARVGTERQGRGKIALLGGSYLSDQISCIIKQHVMASLQHKPKAVALEWDEEAYLYALTFGP